MYIEWMGKIELNWETFSIFEQHWVRYRLTILLLTYCQFYICNNRLIAWHTIAHLSLGLVWYCPHIVIVLAQEYNLMLCCSQCWCYRKSYIHGDQTRLFMWKASKLLHNF